MLELVKDRLAKASQIAKLDNVLRNPKVSAWMSDLKDRDVALYGVVYDQYQLHHKQLQHGRNPSNVN